MRKNVANPADYIVPLDMNGLAGRMLHLPAPKGKMAEILFVYGQHSSLERWWGLLRYVNHYAAVTAPDLPGFGGMESFYKLGKKPTIDDYADYLAAFVKLRYKRKKVAIVGMSFGFVIVTRMLQRYPELANNVTLLVSLAGFVHGDDFKFEPRRLLGYKIISRVFSYWLPSLFFRYVCLNGRVLRKTYHHTYLAKSKFAAAKDGNEHDRFMDMEIWLWQHNDVRTHGRTLLEMFKLDNCAQRVNMPVWHVEVDGDQYFDPRRVEQHLHVTFSDVHIVRSHLAHHAPSIIAAEAEAAPLIPPPLRRVLAKL